MPRQEFYRPEARGFEREIKKRLDYWNKLRHDGGKKEERSE
jgi:putative ATPase